MLFNAYVSFCVFVNLYGGEIFIRVHHGEFYYFGEFGDFGSKNTRDCNHELKKHS
jgi:hypothetical protein